MSEVEPIAIFFDLPFRLRDDASEWTCNLFSQSNGDIERTRIVCEGLEFDGAKVATGMSSRTGEACRRETR